MMLVDLFSIVEKTYKFLSETGSYKSFLWDDSIIYDYFLRVWRDFGFLQPIMPERHVFSVKISCTRHVAGVECLALPFCVSGFFVFFSYRKSYFKWFLKSSIFCVGSLQIFYCVIHIEVLRIEEVKKMQISKDKISIQRWLIFYLVMIFIIVTSNRLLNTPILALKIIIKSSAP